jgi:hypothetical protein
MIGGKEFWQLREATGGPGSTCNRLPPTLDWLTPPSLPSLKLKSSLANNCVVVIIQTRYECGLVFSGLVSALDVFGLRRLCGRYFSC